MKTAIVILVSIAIRIVYVCAVGLFAARIGVGVAMGFDSGASASALALAGAYLLTFVPALVLGFLPSNLITRPPLPLKVWYGWVVVLIGGFALYGTYYRASDFVKSASSVPHGTVCIYISNPNQPVGVIRLGPAETIGEVKATSGLNRSHCTNWSPSGIAATYRFYSAPKQYSYGQLASDDDLRTMSDPVTITVTPRSKICIHPTLDATKIPNKWSAKAVSCKTISDPYISRWGGLW